jgi:putative aldouronate transport system permease protein
MASPTVVKRIGNTKEDLILNRINIFLLSVLLVVYIYPIYFIVIASISDPTSIWNGEVLFMPVNISFEGYKEILHNLELWHGYLNSIIYTVVGVIVNLAFTLTAAYVLSCREFMLRNLLMKIFTFTMFFSGGLIPSFLLVQSLGLLNTMWALILPGAVSIYNVIITRTFFMNSIPYDLKEAAILDGCGHTRYFLSIVIPLSSAIIAVIALYYGVGHWNAYFSAMIYLNDRAKYPLQLIIREIVLKSTTMFENAGNEADFALQMRLAEVVKYCSIIVASIPAMVAYPFVQRFFVKGVMIGSLKG